MTVTFRNLVSLVLTSVVVAAVVLVVLLNVVSQ